MMKDRVFESVRIFGDAQLFKVIGRADRTVDSWNRLLQRELTQDFVFHVPLNRKFKKSEIKVIWVVGDVLCIQTSCTDGIRTMMYINAASLDCLFASMRERKGKQFATFLDAIRKNYYDEYGAAILVIGFIRRNPEKKNSMKLAKTGANFSAFYPVKTARNS
jgi:hypothetical protein